MPDIYYLRHGESKSNVAKTFSGSKDDTPLTPKGEFQAREAGERLRASRIRIDRIVASPLSRTQSTAGIVAKAIDFDPENIETDARLAEYDIGELTGTPRQDVTSAQLIAGEGAEDPHSFMERVAAVLQDLEFSQGNVLVVAHAGVGRIIRCYKEGLDPKGFYDLPPYQNATVVRL